MISAWTDAQHRRSSGRKPQTARLPLTHLPRRWAAVIMSITAIPVDIYLKSVLGRLEPTGSN
jgi:hypothetical protein